jgi:hypothetical protein
MIWTIVVFLITLFILKKFVFGPVGEAIEKRRASITASIEEAESSRDEAVKLRVVRRARHLPEKIAQLERRRRRHEVDPLDPLSQMRGDPQRRRCAEREADKVQRPFGKLRGGLRGKSREVSPARRHVKPGRARGRRGRGNGGGKQGRGIRYVR